MKLQICVYVNKMCCETQQHEYALTTIKSAAEQKVQYLSE